MIKKVGVFNMYREEYFNKINDLRNSINKYGIYDISNKFTSDEYNELIEMLSVVECNKTYSELDESHKLWLNEFMYYDNYYLWRNSKPMPSPQEAGNALRSLFKKSTKLKECNVNLHNDNGEIKDVTTLLEELSDKWTNA